MAKLSLQKNMNEDVRNAFENIGIDTMEQLLAEGSTKAGQKSLARRTQLSEREILTWVNRADLQRIKGIGQEYNDLLEAAGVDSVKNLGCVLPSSLFSKLVHLNRHENHVRRMPSEKMVSSWVLRAKQLSGKDATI